MERDEMTQTEFVAYLELLEQLIKAKAKTVEEAAQIIQELKEKLSKNK